MCSKLGVTGVTEPEEPHHHKENAVTPVFQN
nr:MAG TPA: hypothetical protein [Caudoviricetes sp.]